MKSLAKLKKIKGDASFREFYRNKENKSIVVKDVDLFDGHIACNEASKSEIVIPIRDKKLSLIHI